MTFRLQRNVAFTQEFAVPSGEYRILEFPTQLWLRVGNNGRAFHIMRNALRAHDVCYDSHPLIAVVGLRHQVIAVGSKEPTIDYDVRPRRAHVAIRPIVDAVPAEKLYFDRSREILVQAHALRGLRM